jgi:hypothetical protein
MDSKDTHAQNCNCSRCGGSKRDSDRFSYPYGKNDADSRSMANHPNSYMSQAKKIGLVVVIVMIGIGAGIYLLLALQGVSHPSDLPAAQKPSKPSEVNITSISSNPVATQQQQSKVSLPAVTQQPSFPSAQVTNQQILTQQLFLFSKETSEVSPAKVPTKNNGILEAQITPEKGAVLEAKFYKNGQIFCLDGSAFCAFTVIGDDPTSQKITIPVRSQDSVSALITNNKSSGGFTEQVSVVFIVPYSLPNTTTNNIS